MSMKRIPDDVSEENSMAQPRRRAKAGETVADQDFLPPDGQDTSQTQLHAELVHDQIVEGSIPVTNVRLVGCDMDCQCSHYQDESKLPVDSQNAADYERRKNIDMIARRSNGGKCPNKLESGQADVQCQECQRGPLCVDCLDQGS